MSSIPELDHLQIPLEHIKLATNNFSNDNFIGRGGYGRVYKGHLPNNSGSTTVAVKRLDEQFGQGKHEFLMEIMMLASYKHTNLASLIGFCDEGDEKIIVYKHEARGSLDKYLASTDLPWVQRLQICIGAAQGLNYLHTGAGEGHRVLHRDIKSSNVLLDENWVAKISDFGLSKIGPMNQQFTFLVTHAAGTFGYVDPLYISTGVLTKESDVYSFGVVLFEVLCGRPAMLERCDDERRFLSHLAKLHYEAGTLAEIIAPGIRNQIKPPSLQTFSTIAYECLKPNRSERRDMAWIIGQLEAALKFQTYYSGRVTELWGSCTYGSPWSLQLESNQKLRKITIDHHDWIYSIDFTIRSDSTGLSNIQHGGYAGPSSGRISEVTFDDDEEITGIDGTVGFWFLPDGKVITSLSFLTNKKRYGPLGKETGTRFSVTCDVGSLAGFYGRAGHFLDGFGCFFKD